MEPPRAKKELSLVAYAGLLLFAAILVLSAHLKAGHPQPAAQALAWTGLAEGARLWLVDLLTIGEALLGFALVIFVRRRRVLLGGAVGAALLLLAHVIVLAASDAASCGCFGPVDVPDGVTLGSLALGLLSCGFLARFAAAGRPRRRGLRFALVPILAAATLYPMASRALDDRSDAARELLQALAIEPDARDALVIVGAADCPHCQQAVEALAEAWQDRETLRYIEFFFVTRDSDRAESPTLRRPWLTRRSVPDALWWRLIRVAPPSFVRVHPDLPLTVASEWSPDTLSR